MTGSRPVAVLVEYQAPGLSLTDAGEIARQSAAVLRSVPGLLDARFFGDFEGGTHCFLLIWHDRQAMEAYMASEQMYTVRDAASRFVAGAPIRRVFVDYTSDGQQASEGEEQA